MMRKRFAVLAAMVACSLHVSSPSALAQAGRDTGRARAGGVAPQADDTILQHSAHAKLVCVACHTGLDPTIVPYRGKVEPVACLRCHADAQFKHPFHPEVALAIRRGSVPRVSCKDCHGTHDVASPNVAGSKFSAGRLAESCGKCHKSAAEGLAGSVHGKALAAEAKGAPTCLSCHRQNITLARGAADSLTVKQAQARACQTCHLDSPDVRELMAPSTAFVPQWDRSAHGARLQHGDSAAANCVSCHGSHGIRKRSEPGSTLGRDSNSGTCAKCHPAIEKKFNQSVHGMARTSAKTDSMTCATCHGEHAKPGPVDAKTGVATKPVAAMVCTRCHDPVTFSGTYGISSDRFKDFSDSRHGLALNGGAVSAANCASCHGAHDVKPKNDTTSGVNVANRTATCGKCHTGARELFDIGPVHGKAGARATSARAWVLPVGVILGAGVAGGLLLFGRRRRSPD
jgi:hypothetical protein